MPASLSDPSDYYFAVTPSDTVNCERAFRSLRVATAGDVAVVRKDGTAVVFPDVAAGETLPVEGKRVNSTGTEDPSNRGIVAYA
jgi:hypothetical protein